LQEFTRSAKEILDWQYSSQSVLRWSNPELFCIIKEKYMSKPEGIKSKK